MPAFPQKKWCSRIFPSPPAKGCGTCEKLGRCIQEDDFQSLSQKILGVDVLILATPVYSLSVCAQAKALIDRCQVFWSRKYVPHTFEEPAGTKLGLLIATARQARDHIFDHTYRSHASSLTLRASNRNTQCFSFSMVMIRRPIFWRTLRLLLNQRVPPSLFLHPLR
ncbi:MAG: NAD(P)H-dependent oxidoreductase [Methanocorpusculum sp.]|nr:NAD(P)H-dependent oxidoreductase [Methanocorpusculum sp.]